MIIINKMFVNCDAEICFGSIQTLGTKIKCINPSDLWFYISFIIIMLPTLLDKSSDRLSQQPLGANCDLRFYIFMVHIYNTMWSVVLGGRRPQEEPTESG